MSNYFDTIRLPQKERKENPIMPTISFTREIELSKEDFEKIEASEPSPLFKELYAKAEAKRSKTNLNHNLIKQYTDNQN